MEFSFLKNLTPEENDSALNISTVCDVSFDTARLLVSRNVDTPEKAKRFLNPGKKWFIDPFLLKGVRDAVNKINEVKSKKGSVLICGDYDADGICATTVLYKCLKDFGLTAKTLIPERDEGYGLNRDKILEIHKESKIDLLITVDCGISEREKIEVLKENGIEVIVTDHHEIPELLPDTITVNPKLNGQEYGFNGLCGAGVAFKLGYALIGEKANDYLDYVAIATVADSMDLVDENRDLVYEGLKVLNSNTRSEIKLLKGDNKEITAQSISYGIAPRINAGGRMGDANLAFSLFMEEDENKKFDIASKLNAYNLERQVECDNIFREAKAKIVEEKTYLDSVILVADKKWKTGFVGIVASKLCEEYHRPVIVFAGQGEELKGSARSIPEINIFDAISSAKDILITFGGHSQAAGVAVSEENYLKLREKLNEYVDGIKLTSSTAKVFYEWEITEKISLKFAKELERFEPFGLGNKRPVFAIKERLLKPLPLKENSPHYGFSTKYIDMLDFNGEEDAVLLSSAIEKTLIFELNLSEFKGKEYLKGFLKGVYPDLNDVENAEIDILSNEFKKIAKIPDFKGAKYVKREEAFKYNYGTVYVVPDAETIEDYPEIQSLPINLFGEEKVSCQNTVLISPSRIPEGFSRVVYLNILSSVLPFNGESIIVEPASTFSFLNELDLSRESCLEIFNIMDSLCGRDFISSSWAYNAYDLSVNPYQFVFCAEVFFELKFFSIESGKLKRNKETKKTELNNSKIYSQIFCIL